MASARLLAILLALILASAGIGGVTILWAQDHPEMLREVIQASSELRALGARVAALEGMRLAERLARLESDVMVMMGIGGAIGIAVVTMAAQMILSALGVKTRERK